ncbi:MAG: hypothetical protein JNM93_13000 [Bacteriovoracaceae bacterium]|nr:hypothetical protein [Bacteriovoracaceae bacterium]
MRKLSLLILLALMNTTTALGALNESDITTIKIVQQKLGESHEVFKNRVGEEIEALKQSHNFIHAEVQESDTKDCGKADSAHSLHLCQYKLHYKK